MTDIVLNQLYPGGVMKQLGDAAGGVAYNQYAAGGCVGQLYTAAGADVPLDQYAPGGPLHQIEEEIEGGGGIPDWVPANAAGHIDLVRAFNSLDAAWVLGTGIVAVDTLLGSDPNTENGWNATEYDPANLTADGYVSTGSQPAFIGDALSSLLGSSTLAIRTKQVNELGTSALQIALLSSDGNDAIEIDLVSGDWKAEGYSWGGDTDISTDNNVVNNGLGAVNVLAATITSTRLEFAVSGSDAVNATLDSSDRPPGNPLVAAIVSNGSGDTTALQSITIYDALPSTAGLSELSEAA